MCRPQFTAHGVCLLHWIPIVGSALPGAVGVVGLAALPGSHCAPHAVRAFHGDDGLEDRIGLGQVAGVVEQAGREGIAGLIIEAGKRP